MTEALLWTLSIALIVARGPVPLAALPGVGAAGRFGAAWDGGAAAPLPWQGVAVGVVSGGFRCGPGASRR